jgi:AmiR/NasT family two-component response regulator
MSDLSGPAVVAAMVSAGVSGVIALVGLWVNRSTTIRVSRERFDFEKTLAEQKQSAELQLAERKSVWVRKS